MAERARAGSCSSCPRLPSPRARRPVISCSAVVEAASLRLGATVVVQGLGLLGLYGAAIAKARGARLVVGVDGVASRRDRARRFGVDVALDAGSDAESVAKAVRAACGEHGADAVLEVCGAPQAVEQGIDWLRVGGTYVLAGVVNPGSLATLDLNLVLRKMLTLRGVHNYHPRNLVEALEFVAAHRTRFPFGELVDARYPLERVADAIADAASRKVLRAAIVPQESAP